MATKVQNRFDRVAKAERKASFRNLGHASATVRKVASRSIRIGKKPSAPGTPPHTRKGALRGAILFAADRQDLFVVGPAASLVGPSGKAHEFGGPFRKQRHYDKRPFMGPALEKVASQIPPQWEGTIRE